jgi:L-alanine-DL-glutamate epimerase-like enolase superfamily enzyme
VFGLDYLSIDPNGHWDDAMAAKLADLLPEKYETPWIDMWVDARRFAFPHFPKEHIGEHEEAIRTVATHEKFVDWLTNVKIGFYKMKRIHDTADTFNVAVGCKQGVKRSVACARILTSIWSELGYDCREPRRLTFRGCRCDGSCVTCQTGMDQSETKTAALKKALSAWKRC